MTPREKALQAIREIAELKELDARREVLIRQINDALRAVQMRLQRARG